MPIWNLKGYKFDKKTNNGAFLIELNAFSELDKATKIFYNK